MICFRLPLYPIVLYTQVHVHDEEGPNSWLLKQCPSHAVWVFHLGIYATSQSLSHTFRNGKTNVHYYGLLVDTGGVIETGDCHNHSSFSVTGNKFGRLTGVRLGMPVLKCQVGPGVFYKL